MSSATGGRISWNDWPPEIRHQILRSLLGLEACYKAHYATVSREWQAVIEPHNFARIRLTPTRIKEFASMVHRNRALVRYIWLCLELGKYGCDLCAPANMRLRGFRVADSYMVMLALLDVFSALSGWDPGGTLQLDISIYSPSDSQHWFKYLTFEPDEPSDECDRRRRVERLIRYKCDDEDHGWRCGRRRYPPSGWAMSQIFEDIMADGPFRNDEQERRYWQRLPLVPAVTSVLLRQQNRRRWKPMALASIFARLPRLREVHYEPWRQWVHELQVTTDEGMQSLLVSLASSQVRRLILFETSCPQYLLDSGAFDTDRGSTLVVSRAIAHASLVLEHLSASFMVDASNFFAACEPSWRWLNLTWLALTSRLLTPDQHAENIHAMLEAAAAAALAMEQLEMMEIWNGSEGLAMVFRYKRTRERRPAVMTMRGTWEFALQPAVVDAWDVVARKHGCEGCTIEYEFLDAAAITCPVDAIRCLGFTNPVIRPISVAQIRMEQRIRDGVINMSARRVV